MLSWLIFRNYLLSKRSGALVRIVAWHCILGIAMGVAALIIVLSVMNGFNLKIRSSMLSVEPHLVLAQREEAKDDQATRLQKLVESLSSDGVKEVHAFETQDLIVRSADGSFGGVVGKGYSQDAIYSLLNRIWVSGRRVTAQPQEESARLEAGEVILGSDLARSLSVFEGDEILLIPPETLLLPKGEVPRLSRFKVKALVSTNMPEIDSKLLFYRLGAFPKSNKSLSHDAGFEIMLNNPYEAEGLKKKLAAKDVAVQTWGDRDSSLFFALKVESYAMTLFLSLAVLITSFSIVIVMVLLLSQKRQDIGLLMTMGLSVRRVRATFFQVGLLLSFCGILSGVVVGSILCFAMDRYPMELLPDIYTDTTLPAKLSFSIFVFVLVCSSLIGLVGSWLPAWRYVESSPAVNLRKV